MARTTWFETVAIAQQRAKKRLPKSVYAALIAASEKGLTASDNVEAFGELGFAPHVIGASDTRGRRPRNGDGIVVVRQQADRRGHRGEPQTLLSAVLAR